MIRNQGLGVTYTPMTPISKMLVLGDCECKVSLDNLARLCFKEKQFKD